MSAILEYYTTPGRMTDPGVHAERFARMPGDLGELCGVVQGLLIHPHWASAYGFQIPEERQGEVNLRPVEAMLSRILELDSRPLDVERPLDRRLVGNCRHFSVLLCAMLRHQGVAARARCGFGAYFRPGTFEDHWVCERWSGSEGGWVLSDAQIDGRQRDVLKLRFDPLDVPRTEFVIAGDAWQRCRRGEADPSCFGIFDMRGLWFIRGNVIRDLASLNNLELLPWDGWGIMSPNDNDLDAEGLALVDRTAALTLGGDEVFDETRALYAANERLRVPPVIDSYTPTGVVRVEL